MTTSTALRPAVRAALSELIDYAGLFPPAQLSLDAARREYEAARAGQYAWMLGRFIIPASQLATPAPFNGPFSIVVEPELDAFKHVADLLAGGAQIEALEIPLRKNILPDEIADTIDGLQAGIAAAGLRDLRVFLEVPRTESWLGLLSAAMEAIAAAQLGAKLRCGGLTADAFPSVDEVVEFVIAAQRKHVPFKATAGLHHPVRRRNSASGFMMHGFVNLLAAAALAPHAGSKTLRSVVAEEESDAFSFEDTALIWRGERIELSELTATRRYVFVAYGSCSFSEPVDDLTALGVLSAQ